MNEDADQDRKTARLLALALSEPVPAPPTDLVPRSMQAVRRLIVLSDLARFATLEALWRRLHARKASHARWEAGDTEPPDSR